MTKFTLVQHIQMRFSYQNLEGPVCCVLSPGNETEVPDPGYIHMASCVLGVVVTTLQATVFVLQLGPQQVLEIGFVTVLIIVRVDFLTLDLHLHVLEQVVCWRRFVIGGQRGSICFLVDYLWIDFDLRQICVQVVGFEGEFEGGGSVCQHIVRHLGD